MSKRTRSLSADKKLKDGRGLGIGVDYKPWLIIQDVSSLGRSTRLKGVKIARQYEFLSDLERNYFYLLEYSDLVVGIREQYHLLPVEETIVIADELGLKHPADPRTGEPIVMTTDFLVTVRSNQHIARTLKYKDELMNKRVLEKFEIERLYWERKDINWGIVTELEVPKYMAHNISFVHSYTDLSKIEGFEQSTVFDIEDMSVYFIKSLLDENKTVRQIAKELEHDFGMSYGCGLSLFKHLIITKAIEMDLVAKLDMNEIQLVRGIRKDFSEKVKVI